MVIQCSRRGHAGRLTCTEAKHRFTAEKGGEVVGSVHFDSDATDSRARAFLLREFPRKYSAGAPAPRLLDRVRQTIRARHYSPKTEKSYVAWIKRYVVFHGKRHPSEMGTDEVRAFLSWLATEKHVSASTQNQALSALLFLYRDVLGGDIPDKANRGPEPFLALVKKEIDRWSPIIKAANVKIN